MPLLLGGQVACGVHQRAAGARPNGGGISIDSVHIQPIKVHAHILMLRLRSDPAHKVAKQRQRHDDGAVAHLGHAVSGGANV